MIHIDLFSGIGGFSYAADHVWELDHIFCDIDPFCRAITNKHWPGSKHYADIRQIIADTADGRFWKSEAVTVKKRFHAGREEIRKLEGRPERPPHVWLVTGGFPCQPFSHAGRRMGTADNRYLWPEMFRVIQLTKPTWIIAENVGGFVTYQSGMVLEQVCTDLESEGYEVQTFIIPAVAVNAPHRRDRVWIVANKQLPGLEGRTPKGVWKGQHGQRHRVWGKEAPDWSKDWIEVATRLCGVDDGLPGRVDGLELYKSAHRRERLKSLGNAIVPQVAYEIMKTIKGVKNE